MHPSFAMQQHMLTFCQHDLDVVQRFLERLDAANIIPYIELVGTNTLWQMEALTH